MSYYTIQKIPIGHLPICYVDIIKDTVTFGTITKDVKDRSFIVWDIPFASLSAFTDHPQVIKCSIKDYPELYI
jgi:hypothetical protein